MKLLNGKHVLLIDDHEVFRRGLRTLIQECCPQCQVSDAASVEQVVAGEVAPPDLVSLDIRLPGVDGLEAIPQLRARWPQVPVVVLSSLDGPEVRAEALARGAAQCISKGESSERILAQLRDLLRGPETPTAPAGQAAAPTSRLTQRQRDVLLLLCQGMANKLIARQLGLSENTVRRHVQDILEYFQADSRAAAVFAARRRGLVE